MNIRVSASAELLATLVASCLKDCVAAQRTQLFDLNGLAGIRALQGEMQAALGHYKEVRA